MMNIVSDWLPDAFRIPDKANNEERRSTYIRFSCRTEDSSMILRQAIEDRASIDGIPVYNAYEDALLEASLPKDQYARRFALIVLGEQAHVLRPLHKWMPPVQHALIIAFEILADMENGFWKLPESKELARYAAEYAEAKDFFIGVKGGRDRVAEAFEAVNTALAREGNAKQVPPKTFSLLTCEGDPEANSSCEDFLTVPQTLLRHLSEEWDEAWALPEIHNLVLVLLGASLEFGDGRESAKDRMGFIEMCRAVMPAWTAEEAKRKIEAEKERTRIATKSHAIKGGALNCPATWKLANLEEAAEWEHAARVSVLNAAARNNDGGLGEVDEVTRIVLLPCPFDDIGETEEERSERVIEMAAKSWPDLPRILDARVKLKYARSGKPINWDEWKTSLRVSVSKVPEMSAAAAAANGYVTWIEKDPEEGLYL